MNEKYQRMIINIHERIYFYRNDNRLYVPKWVFEK